MLLTYPNKESLLRNLFECPIDQSYMIIGNYKKLADWSLIPMSPMTVFLGPNSAGKSAVSDALEIFRQLYGYKSDFNSFGGYRALKDKDGIPIRDVDYPCIGFSLKYPKNISLIGLLDEVEVITKRLLLSDLKNGFFPLLEKYNDDVNFLKDIRITIIFNTHEELDLNVYLNNKLVSTFLNWGAKNIEIDFDDIIFNDIFKDYLFNLSNKKISASFTESEIRFGGFPYYAYEIDWGEAELFNAENKGLNYDTTPFADHLKRRDAIISLLIILYHIPMMKMQSLSEGFSSSDLRKMPKDWVEPKRIEEQDDWAPTKNIFISSTEEYQPALRLIANQISFFIKNYTNHPNKYGGPHSGTDVLSNINHFLSHASFLDSKYKLKVEIKAIISIEKLNNNFLLSDALNEYPLGIEFIGKAYLTDQEGRELDFDSVGAGYEQVCPILIALAFGDTTLFKQPEVHLHPRLQSRLADCFIYSLNENHTKFSIIETHSEHFVLRLLRRVRESYLDALLHSSLTLAPKDFSLIYFRPVGDKTLIYEIRVSDDGQFIDAWPEGFFDDRDEDIWGPLN